MILKNPKLKRLESYNHSYNSIFSPLMLFEDTPIERKGVRFYQVEKNVYYPSITSVLGHFSKRGIEEWKKRVGENEAENIRKKSANRGTRIHKAFELYFDNYDMEEVVAGLTLQEFEMFKYGIQKIPKPIHTIFAQETAFFSKQLKIAGRVDVGFVEKAGFYAVLDIKTSQKPKKEEWVNDHYIQATAYSQMIYECTNCVYPHYIYILNLNAEEPRNPQLFVSNPEKHLKELQAKVSLFRKEVSCDQLLTS